jgi:dihydroorotase
VLHITTAMECGLFDAADLQQAHKQITSEACVHHLHFCDEDYARLGNRLKCNPAVKSAQDRAGLWQALAQGRIDAITTDHAPHLLSEKNLSYRQAPAGLPFVQHNLAMVLRWVQEGRFTLPEAVRLLAHNPAKIFGIQDRGYLDEGAWADIVL